MELSAKAGDPVSIDLHRPLVAAMERLTVRFARRNAGASRLAVPLALSFSLEMAQRWPRGKWVELTLGGPLSRVGIQSGYHAWSVPFAHARGRQAQVDAMASSIALAFAPWFPQALSRRACSRFRDAGYAVRWVSPSVQTGPWRGSVHLTVDEMRASGKLVIANRRRVVEVELFRTIAATTSWLPLMGTLKANQSAIWVESQRGALLATAAGVVRTGHRTNARRFSVSLKTLAPQVTQRWELTWKRGMPARGTQIDVGLSS